MPVEQFYYTSWDDPTPGGGSGFHPRGASPGLTDEDKRALTDLAAYTLPTRLDPRKPDQAPVALRYSVLAPEKAALLHCQATGAEPKGRSANYFAHAVLLEPEAFAHTPPALYWGSPFWRASADGEGIELPELPNFDPEPALDLAAVWRFVGEEPRRGWLYHLLCAVIHSASAKRRVVIVDTPEHVALWVAAISLLLPSRYRPLLTFATYHHNPHQASYLITGTRSDVEFELATSDYLSFFVLDTENERISQGTDSPYARFAADCARPDLYGERMLMLLSMCDRLFPPDGAINERLDDALAYHARVMANAGPVTPAARRALARAIETMCAGDAKAADRIEDLNEAYTLLLTALPETPEPGLITTYEQVASMLREADPQGAAARLPRELWLATRLIVSGALAPGRAVAGVIQRVYGAEMIGGGLNSLDYLRELTRLSASAPAPAMLNVWGFVGARVLPSPDSLPALLAMLRRAPGITPTGLSGDGAEYIEALAIATRAHAPSWLNGAARNSGGTPPQALRGYYYMLVKELPPERRTPYRDAMPDSQALVTYEIQHDLTDSHAEVNQAALERWADYARSSPNGRTWVSIAMNHLWAVTPPDDRPPIAKRSLMRPSILAQINDRSKDTLLHEALKGITLKRQPAEDLAFCQQFQHNTRLTAAERALIQGALAMDNGQLDAKTALELRDRFGRMPPEMYATESRDFITRFFQQDVTSEAHEAMITATYSLGHSDAFWQSYGGALLTLMIDVKTAKRAAQLIGYWFDSYASAAGLGQFPYAVQLFFMCLPQLFESAQKERGYREAAREIEQYCADKPWYPMVRGLIAPEAKRAKTLFGR